MSFPTELGVEMCGGALCSASVYSISHDPHESHGYVLISLRR